MEQRLGFVGIIIEERLKVAKKVNSVLFDFGEIIIGRIGLPYKEKSCNVITLIINANSDQLGALTGQLGKVEGVSVKSALAKKK
ncbi:MAG: iron-only hydrogenase system regulator [Candidatus Omnitrophica bacterium]|nr:iron-only hydrogenase system regulator [Candidatus Omnitrophota bacterium]MCF7893549.1 iron-only hydrogenase system regulator [Candidatus Omnitrophota bacterium]